MCKETNRKTTLNNPSFFSKFLSMFSPNPPEKSTLKSISEFERVFIYFDEDGDGKISPAELRNRMGSMDLTLEDAEVVVGSTDSDGDGYLGLDDFMKLVEVEVDDEEKAKSLRGAFEVYSDVEGEDHRITAESLRRVLERLMGEVRSVEECREMIRRFDVDGDGVISFDEFRIMMC